MTLKRFSEFFLIFFADSESASKINIYGNKINLGQIYLGRFFKFYRIFENSKIFPADRINFKIDILEYLIKELKKKLLFSFNYGFYLYLYNYIIKIKSK